MEKKKGVSAIDFFCIGFGAIVGVGWAVSINSWMNSSGGPLPAAAGYLVAMVLMVPIALCYCELCTMLPVSGGGMAYAFRAFGDRIAFLSGWAAFGAFITIIPWEAIYVVDILSIVFPILKAGTPLYTLAGADIYIGHIILGTVISIVLYIINRKGVASSATLQKVLCIALVGAGILAMICAVIKFDVHNLQPFYENTGVGSHNSFIGGMASILASVPFFLAGFETIPQGIESAGGDTKGVGKTVVITVVLSCLFYALLLFTLGGALPWKEFIHFSNPSAALMFRTLYPGRLGNILYILILFGAVCGLLTTWNGFMMASSQILMAMAKVSIVPFSLSRQHPVYKTPINALKVSLVASLIGPFLGSGLIGSLTSFSAAGYVASWMITAFSLIILRKKEPALKRPYKIPGGLAMAWFAAVSMTGLFILLFVPEQPVFMGGTAILIFVAWMIGGVALYLKDYRARKQYSLLTRTAFLFASMSESNATITLPGFVDSFESDYKVMSFVVPKDAEYAGKTLMELYWGRRQNVFIIKIERKTEIILVPGGSVHVHAGDRVFAVGVAKALDRFRDYQDVGTKYSVFSLKDFMGYGDTEKQSPLSCIEYRVQPTDTFCDQVIRESRIQDRYQLMIVGLKTPYSKILELPTATTLIEAGDILWMMGSEDAIEAFEDICRREAEEKGETTTGLDI